MVHEIEPLAPEIKIPLCFGSVVFTVKFVTELYLSYMVLIFINTFMDPTINQIRQLISQIESLQEELDTADEIIENIFEGTIFEEEEKWIQGAIKKPGALRKSMKVKEGKKIPKEKLEKAAEGGNTKKAKRARLALTLAKLRNKKKK